MTVQGRVLVVEDQEPERRAMMALLKSEGFAAQGAGSADKALGYLDEQIDLVLTDLHLGAVSGVELMQRWRRHRPQTQFILVTGENAPANIVDAIKKGAYHYVTKPINKDELFILIRRALEAQRQEQEIIHLKERLDQKFGLDQIVGESRLMKEVFARIRRAAPVDSTVLILGESGTGKELVAQALHHNSRRKNGPFVAVNCAAVPATLVESELFGHVRGAFTGATERRIGRFEQADGGTLFIDEIGDFELGLQAKLLRVIETLTVTPVGGHEDRKVDVRVLTATSRDLNRMVAEGRFREDLFYRLNVVSVQLPPLRDRPDDIPTLVHHFLDEISRKKHTTARRVAPEVMRCFERYGWPGNVRELRNALESMMVLSEGEVLVERDLPERLCIDANKRHASSATAGELTMNAVERVTITAALEQAAGNRTHAAEQLGISLRSLQRKLREYAAEDKTIVKPEKPGGRSLPR